MHVGQAHGMVLAAEGAAITRQNRERQDQSEMVGVLVQAFYKTGNEVSRSNIEAALKEAGLKLETLR